MNLKPRKDEPNIVWKAKYAVGYTISSKKHKDWLTFSPLKTRPGGYRKRVKKIVYERKKTGFDGFLAKAFPEIPGKEKEWKTFILLHMEGGEQWRFIRGAFFFDPPLHIQKMEKRLNKTGDEKVSTGP